MKKLVLFAAVAVAVSFASCKPKAAQEPVVEEAVIEEVVAVDTTAVEADTTAIEVVEEVVEAK